MRTQRLCSITVENFRSIAGRHTIALDAPVVLVHGLNGAGKTSLLSAIEYGLTGELSSLDAIEKGYRRQLPHLGQDGSVYLATKGVELANPAPIAVPASGARVRGMLEPRLARFFSTRCYLAQSTLSQLLTVYGTDEGALGSPLSQFAADLLGLDRLDALQLGLRPARDVRNLRNLAPSYRSFEEKRDLATTTVETAERALADAQARHVDARQRYASVLASLVLEPTVSDEELGRGPTDQAMTDLSERERAIEAAFRSAARIEATRAPEPAAIAAAAEQAAIMATRWRDEAGRELAAFLADARRHLPDAPTSVTADIQSVVAMLASQLAAAAVEQRAIIARMEVASRRMAAIDDLLVRRRETAAAVERRIEIGAAQAPDLAAALAAVLPHVHGDDCPVCGRDYREVSEHPLREVITERVEAIQRGAAALANDTADRSRLVGEIATLERERSSVAATQVDPVERQNLDRVASQVEALASRATALLPAAETGAGLLAEEVRTARLRSDHADGEAAATLLLDEVVRLETSVGIDDSGQATLEARLAALRDRARADGERLGERSRLLGDARELKQLVGAEQERLETAQARVRAAAETRQRVNEAERAIRAIRDVAGRVETAAAEVRARVVSQVFNDQLNRLWRDLFVRLAPDESFVPRFEVPANVTGRLRPVLRAESPAGDLGGSPSIMLSSGNLNTAALTLFLALHLAVEPALPWLVLDDPVQAMDDVHVSSFAALLRTLAKEKGRQIIIAVHNRALFDYLVLEMTPAFAGDELITVEFERSAAGELRVDPRRHSYRPRPRIVAAA